MNPFFTRCLTFGLIAALTLTTAAASAETVKSAYGDNAIDTARHQNSGGRGLSGS